MAELTISSDEIRGALERYVSSYTPEVSREEVGIACGEVRYFASQPWPFPTSLMIGCHAEALTHEIVVDREELEGARWFSKDEVESMLMRKHPQGLTTPPPVAIAHHIIRAWLEDEISFD